MNILLGRHTFVTEESSRDKRKPV